MNDLLKQIQELHDKEQYQKIIDAIENLPQEEWGYELTYLLAQAYNKLGYAGLYTSPEVSKQAMEKAISLLKSVEEQGKDDTWWHFQIGYALFWLEREEEALPCLQKASALDCNNWEAGKFISLSASAIMEKKKKERGAAKESRETLKLAKEIRNEIWAETSRPVLRYTLKPGEPGLFQSKLGGTPYLPHDEAWPLNGNGDPMELLAQIDCAKLKDLPDFPHEGLLQFFHSRDEMYGMDYNDPITQTGFRVIYRETVDSTVTLEEVRAKRPAPREDEEDYYSPVAKPCRMVFKKAGTMGMTFFDYRFGSLFTEKWNKRRPDAPLKNLWELYQRLPNGDYDFFIHFRDEKECHQMGGYPYFTQDDPRGDKEEYQDMDVLLFQLASEFDGTEELTLWGDMGVGNFFISPEALRNKDFSRVLYTWDCC